MSAILPKVWLSVQVWLSTLFVALWAIWMESSVRVRLFMTFCSSTRLQLKNVSFQLELNLKNSNVQRLLKMMWQTWDPSLVSPLMRPCCWASLVCPMRKTSRLCWLLSLLFWRKTTRCVWLWLAMVLTYQILSLKPRNSVFRTRWFLQVWLRLVRQPFIIRLLISSFRHQPVRLRAWPIWKPWLAVPLSLLMEILIWIMWLQTRCLEPSIIRIMI